MYSDNEYKWVAVLNRRFPLPQLLNALGHLALSVQMSCRLKEAYRHHSYKGADGSELARISHWPLIVLEGDNDNQLRTLRESALSKGFACQAFVGSMLGFSAEDQLRRTQEADLDKLDFLAVLLFGRAEELRGITKRFSLWKTSVTASQNRSTLSSYEDGSGLGCICEGF
jgi:hypothetical protein